jgi:hypothetical protein
VALRSLLVEDDNKTVIGVEGDELANKTVFKNTAKLEVDCIGVAVYRNYQADIKQIKMQSGVFVWVGLRFRDS